MTEMITVRAHRATLMRVAATLLIVLGLLFGLSGVASASTPAHVDSIAQLAPQSAPMPSAVNSNYAVCPATGGNTNSPAESSYLPINRWADSATSFHDELDAKPFSDLFEKMQRGMLLGTMVSFGNAIWKLSANIAGFATNFCLIDYVGKSADTLTNSLGKSIIDNGVISFLVLLIVAFLLWKTARGAGTMKALAKPLIILGLAGVFIIGSGASTASTPGAGSPWWFAAKMEKTVSDLAAAPLIELSQAAGGTKTAAAGTTNGMSCKYFTLGLDEKYKAQFASGGKTNLSSTVPFTMSKMWEGTGLQVWVKSQFGDQNPWGNDVFCYRLENEIGTPADERTDIMFAGMHAAAPGKWAANVLFGARPWTFNGDKHLEDAAIIGLAACNFDLTKSSPGNLAFGVNQGWSGFANGGDAGGGGDLQSSLSGHAVTPADCKWLWTDTSDVRDRSQYEEHNMLYPDDPSYIQNESLNASWGTVSQKKQVANFLLNWHGNNNSSAFVLSAVYIIAAIIMLIVFGVIALGIIIAKVAAAVMLALVILVTMASLWPGASASRIAKYAKMYLGVTIFTVCISAIFSLIILVSNYLTEASGAVFGEGSILSVIWSGMSPIVAVIVLHMLFKNVFKMPSPFSVSGAMAFGGAAAGMGAIGAMGAERMLSRTRHRAQNAMRKSLHSGGQGLMNKFRKKKDADGGVDGAGATQTMRAKRTSATSAQQTSSDLQTQSYGSHAAAPGGPNNSGPSGRSVPDAGAPDVQAMSDNELKLASVANHRKGVVDKFKKDRENWKALPSRPGSGKAAAVAKGYANTTGRGLHDHLFLPARASAEYQGARIKDAGIRFAQKTAARGRKIVTAARANPAKAAMYAAGGLVAMANLPVLGAAGLAASAIGSVGGLAMSHIGVTAVAGYALKRRHDKKNPGKVAQRSARRREFYANRASAAALPPPKHARRTGDEHTKTVDQILAQTGHQPTPKLPSSRGGKPIPRDTPRSPDAESLDPGTPHTDPLDIERSRYGQRVKQPASAAQLDVDQPRYGKGANRPDPVIPLGANEGRPRRSMVPDLPIQASIDGSWMPEWSTGMESTKTEDQEPGPIEVVPAAHSSGGEEGAGRLRSHRRGGRRSWRP